MAPLKKIRKKVDVNIFETIKSLKDFPQMAYT